MLTILFVVGLPILAALTMSLVVYGLASATGKVISYKYYLFVAAVFGLSTFVYASNIALIKPMWKSFLLRRSQKSNK